MGKRRSRQNETPPLRFDENRKLCSIYLSIMDKIGVELESFGDADTRLAGL